MKLFNESYCNVLSSFLLTWVKFMEQNDIEVEEDIEKYLIS